MKTGAVVLKAGDGLPDLGDDALKTYEAKAEASGGRGEETASVSVFGNEAKLKTAINLLGQIDGDEARELKVELEALAKGFVVSGNSSRYASSAFDKRTERFARCPVCLPPVSARSSAARRSRSSRVCGTGCSRWTIWPRGFPR